MISLQKKNNRTLTVPVFTTYMHTSLIKKIRTFLSLKRAGLILRLRRLKLKLSGTPRPTSYPVITGDSFRALAKHVYDETSTFIPGGVDIGEIVFVGQSYALRYLQEIHPNIIVPYILIIHNGDEKIDERYTSLFDENIIHCFAQNIATTHKKLTAIPIGLANFYHYVHTEAPYRKTPEKITRKEGKKNRVFYHFSPQTCPSVRVPLLGFCGKHPLMDTNHSWLSQRSYLQLFSQYKFVIAPRGNASMETHRTYEALHLGVIPIIINSPAVLSLKASGIPLWVIDAWNALEHIHEDDIANKYEELMEESNFEALSMDYWIKEIQKKLNT